MNPGAERFSGSRTEAHWYRVIRLGDLRNQNVIDVIPGTATNGISVTLLGGDFYFFAPEEGFQLSPGEKRRIEVDHSAWMIKEDQSPIGIYMVYYDNGGRR